MTPRELGLLINLLTIVVVIANVGMTMIARRRAYRAGWLDGRIAMVLSMNEAMRRGMGLVEWLQAEAERDGIEVEISVGGQPE